MLGIKLRTWLSLLLLGLYGGACLWASSTPHDGAAAVAHGGHHGIDGMDLELFWGIPFAGVLLSIALMPLFMEHFWHDHYGKVALFWALLFAIPFYLNYHEAATYEFSHIMLLDYVPFIILLSTLFAAAGGICLKGTLRGSPVVNTGILALGTVLASFMGTTGAAMLLIRPMIKANKWRKKQAHLMVFFIFLVANIGGSLTPLGDPPLFLGFLKGVSFFWTLHMAPLMLVSSAILLVVFFLIDTVLYKKEGTPPDDGVREPLHLEGKVNFLILGGIIGAILLSSSLSKTSAFFDQTKFDAKATEVAEASKLQAKASETLSTFVKAHEKDLKAVGEELKTLRVAQQDATNKANSLRSGQEGDAVKGVKVMGVTVPFTNVLRDVLLIILLVLSIVLTKASTRADNFFSWAPIMEVAKLFAAIFLTIIPVLKILQAGVHGQLASVIWAVLEPNNSANDVMYFWFTGALSSFLDNAPTYVVFFNTAGGDAASLMAGTTTLLAISAGAVFMGANTYIGNAPNFMVKSIAEENHIKMPSFFGYMAWSVAFLVPVFILLTFMFFVH